MTACCSGSGGGRSPDRSWSGWGRDHAVQAWGEFPCSVPRTCSTAEQSSTTPRPAAGSAGKGCVTPAGGTTSSRFRSGRARSIDRVPDRTEDGAMSSRILFRSDETTTFLAERHRGHSQLRLLRLAPRSAVSPEQTPAAVRAESRAEETFWHWEARLSARNGRKRTGRGTNTSARRALHGSGWRERAGDWRLSTLPDRRFMATPCRSARDEAEIRAATATRGRNLIEERWTEGGRVNAPFTRSFRRARGGGPRASENRGTRRQRTCSLSRRAESELRCGGGGASRSTAGSGICASTWQSAQW